QTRGVPLWIAGGSASRGSLAALGMTASARDDVARMTKPTFDLSPGELRRLGVLTADAVAAHREGLLAHPVFGKIGAKASLFDEPLPEEGEPFENVLAFVREHVAPFPMGNSHPRFFGF